MKHGPKVNQRVEIIVKDDANFPGTYISRVDDIFDDVIKLSMPYSNGELVPLRPGMEIEVTYMDKTAIFSFDTIIINRVAEPIPFLLIKNPKEIIRIQRRDYVRVDSNLMLKYMETSDALDERPKSKWLNGIAKNLSGGGIYFTPLEIPKGLCVGSSLRIKLDLPAQTKPIEAKARILRMDSTEENSLHYRIAAVFTTISTQSRDAIMRYVFDRQRELMRKGIV